MRNLLFITLFICLACCSNAQMTAPSTKRTGKETKNIISLNPGSIVQNFFYPVTGNVSENEYTFMYHRIVGKANGIRVGTNFSNGSSTSTRNDTSISSTQLVKLKFGIGYERFAYLSKSWNLYFGVDVQIEP